MWDWKTVPVNPLTSKGRIVGGGAFPIMEINLSTKLYIGNISPDADQENLEALFSIFGVVERAYIITDRQTGHSKGFGFVEMGSASEAQAAITALDGKQCDGYTVKVNEAKAQD